MSDEAFAAFQLLCEQDDEYAKEFICQDFTSTIDREEGNEEETVDYDDDPEHPPEEIVKQVAAGVLDQIEHNNPIADNDFIKAMVCGSLCSRVQAQFGIDTTCTRRMILMKISLRSRIQSS